MSLLLELGDGGALGGDIIPDAADPAIAVLLETSAGVWQDISADFVAGSIRRGKQRELDDYQAGTCSLVLNNTNRQYDPSNSAGPYYGSILPMKRLWVLASWAGITYSRFFGYIDRWIQTKQGPHHGTTTVTATDAFKVLNRADLPSSVWVAEVSADSPAYWFRLGDAAGSTAVVDSITGRSATLNHAPTLGASGLIAHDADTALAAANTGGSVSTDGATYNPTSPILTAYPLTLSAIVKPTAGMNAGAILSLLDASGNFVAYLVADTVSATFQIYTTSSFTFIAGATNIYDGNPHLVTGVWDASGNASLYIDGVQQGATAPFPGTLRAATQLLIGAGGPQLGMVGTIDEAALFLSAPAAARIAAWSSARATPWNGDRSGARVGRVLDNVAFSATMRTIATGKSTLQSADLDMTALAHLQKVAQSEFGNLYISAAGYVVFEQRTDQINQPTLGTFAYDGGGGLGFETTSPEIADDLIRNKVTISRTGGVAQTAQDATSIAAYQTLSYTRDGLYHNSDALSRDAATFFVSEYKTPIERVNQLTINPYADPTNLFPQALGRELTDKISLIEKPQGVGAAVTRTLIIEGIADTFTAKQWKTVLNLSPAFTGAFLQLDNSTVTIEGANPGRIFF